MQSMALRGPDGEPQPGLESQGRAASMPRLAAETQVGSLGGSGSWEGWGLGHEETWHREGLCPMRSLPTCATAWALSALLGPPGTP